MVFFTILIVFLSRQIQGFVTITFSCFYFCLEGYHRRSGSEGESVVGPPELQSVMDLLLLSLVHKHFEERETASKGEVVVLFRGLFVWKEEAPMLMVMI